MRRVEFTAPMIVASDLVVERRRRVVLDGLTCDLDDGIVAVVGANGSGKSTLLQVVGGLLRPTSGDLSVLGVEVGRRGGRRRLRGRIGYAEQTPRFPGERATVTDALQYAAWLHRLSRSTRRRRIGEVTEQFALGAVTGRRVGELSGGTRQRLAIALSVLHRPELLLLDEPTAGVDVEHRGAIRTRLRELAAETRILMSTHVSEDVTHLADRVVGLDDGRIVAECSAERFLASADPMAESPFESALANMGRPVPGPVG